MVTKTDAYSLSGEEEDYWLEAVVNKSEEEVESSINALPPDKQKAVNALIAETFFPKTKD